MHVAISITVAYMIWSHSSAENSYKEEITLGKTKIQNFREYRVPEFSP